MGGEGAAKGDSIAIVVFVGPDGRNTLDDAVASGDVALPCAIERKRHGFDTGLGGDEKEAGKDGDADFKGFCFLALVVLPEGEFHVCFGRKVLSD